MGFSSKDGGLESEGKKWVIAGISVRVPLKSIRTKEKQGFEDEKQGFEEENAGDESGTTPTGKESRIPEILPCPAAPRKPRPSAICKHGGAREFFTPPDLDSVFKCNTEREK